MAVETLPSTSRVLEDIMNLEQDFKYNLNLLKIRDLEIERCRAVNQGLQGKLNQAICENKELNKKYIQATHEFEAFKEEKRKEREVLEIKLEREQNEKRQNQERIQHIFGNKFRQKSDLMQIISEMKLSEQKHKDRLVTYENQIQQQKREVEILKTKYSKVVEENVLLSNKINDINARSVSEICMYKHELQKNSNESALLKKETILMKNDYKAYLNAQAKLVRENNDLQMKIIAAEKSNEDCIISNRRLTQELKILKIKFDTLKQSHMILSEQNATFKERDSSELNENLEKQNKIMQEIIKSLRKQLNNE